MGSLSKNALTIQNIVRKLRRHGASEDIVKTLEEYSRPGSLTLRPTATGAEFMHGGGKTIEPRTGLHRLAREAIRRTHQPKKAKMPTKPLIDPDALKTSSEVFMDPLTQTFFDGLESEIVKTSGAIAAAPAAQSMAQKALAAMRRRPVGTAAVAAAGGAGAATGVAEAKKKKEQEERRRARVRALLMRRLTFGA